MDTHHQRLCAATTNTQKLAFGATFVDVPVEILEGFPPFTRVTRNFFFAARKLVLANRSRRSDVVFWDPSFRFFDFDCIPVSVIEPR